MTHTHTHTHTHTRNHNHNLWCVFDSPFFCFPLSLSMFFFALFLFLSILIFFPPLDPSSLFTAPSTKARLSCSSQFWRAFVVMNFHFENMDFAMRFCMNFLCGFLGALQPFRRRTDSDRATPAKSTANPSPNPCKINRRVGKTKSTVKVGSWSAVKPLSRRSDNTP